MTEVIIGLLLATSPFLLLLISQNKIRTLARLVVWVASFNIALTIITQATGIFIYPVILTIHIIVACLVAAVLIKKRHSISISKPNIALIIAIFIIFFQLWTVHYNYSGEVQTIRGPQIVEKSSYGYPKFSDEWITAAIVERSLTEKSLPTTNPLMPSEPFFNLLLPFHSLLSGIFLLLNLSPVYQYSLASIATGILTCLALYILMRRLDIGSIPSILSILMVPFITNSANLPGIWFLLPYNVSLILFLILLISIREKDNLNIICSAALTTTLYPPMALFIVPALIACFFIENRPTKLVISISSILVLLAGATIFLAFSDIAKDNIAIQAIKNGIFHKNLDGGIVSYSIWDIMPIISLPLIALGIYELVRKKVYIIIGPILVGAAYWIFYSVYMDVIFIEHPRAVMITSILFIVVTAKGINLMFEPILKSKMMIATKAPAIILTVALLSSAALTITNPTSESWKNMKLIPPQGSALTPASPINRYITDDDLRLFSGISEKIFIAPPWKGLVIGTVSNNYPLHSKSSTITNMFLNYSSFDAPHCYIREHLAQQFSIDYVYSGQFTCDGFEEMGRSNEGLYLYRYNPAMIEASDGL